MGLGQQPEVVAAIETWAAERRGRYRPPAGPRHRRLGARRQGDAQRAQAGGVERVGVPTVATAGRRSPCSTTSTRYTVMAALDRLDPRADPGQRDLQVGRHRRDAGAVPDRARVARAGGGRRAAADTWSHHRSGEGGAARDGPRGGDRRRSRCPPAVGGRFSVLTAVGLVPAALLGIDIDGAARRRPGGRRARPSR